MCIRDRFGTGCLKVTPAHDINDHALGLKHNLETIDIFNDDGTISEAAGLYVGLDRMDVRKQISRDLNEAGLMAVSYTHLHCGFGVIQQHSTVEHDYLSNGFWAYKYSEELPNPGITASILQRMEDVTCLLYTSVG